MNEYYRNRVALPRQCRNAENLKDSLEAWVEYRLMHVYEACVDLNDDWRTSFGAIHLEYADKVREIVSLPSEQIKPSCTSLLAEMQSRFELSKKACMPGWLKGSIGLCGTELEKIMEMKSG